MCDESFNSHLAEGKRACSKKSTGPLVDALFSATLAIVQQLLQIFLLKFTCSSNISLRLIFNLA